MWTTSAATPPRSDALAWVFEHQMMMPIYWSAGRERCRDFARARLDERIWPFRVVSGEEGAR